MSQQFKERNEVVVAAGARGVLGFRRGNDGTTRIEITASNRPAADAMQAVLGPTWTPDREGGAARLLNVIAAGVGQVPIVHALRYAANALAEGGNPIEVSQDAPDWARNALTGETQRFGYEGGHPAQGGQAHPAGRLLQQAEAMAVELTAIIRNTRQVL